MTPETLYATIDKVRPGRFDCSLKEMGDIVNRYPGQVFEIGYDAFRYGFLKGQRAAEAQKRKEKVTNA